jgi:hypothetical protein
MKSDIGIVSPITLPPPFTVQTDGIGCGESGKPNKAVFLTGNNTTIS